jgi:hypothetical protein
MPKLKATKASCAAFILALTLLNGVARAQQPELPDLTIDAAMRTQVIYGVLQRLNEAYVFLDIARKMEQSIRERVSNKEYDQITSAKEFVAKLTKDRW